MGLGQIAISIQQHLLDDVGALAKKPNISKNKLCALALEEFVQINAALDDSPGEVERKIQVAMKNKQRKILESDPWQ